MTRLSWECVGLLLLTLITPCASAAGAKRVLILDPFQRDVAPYHSVVSAFRSTLARESGEPVDFYEVPLDLARFDEPEKEGPLAAFLEARIKNHPVDLVVIIGGPGVQFAARHRERIFADIPILLVGPDPRTIPPGFLQTNAALVTHKVNLSGMVEDILQIQPQTTNIAVVFGSSALESFWIKECRREFQPFTNRVRFTWLDGLSLKQVLERCAALPPHSFILYPMFLADADGVSFENHEALRSLHESANAPIFGYYASDMGLGPIGGRLYPDSAIGARAGRTAIRILHGERPETITPQFVEATAPTFDWRELRRWGVSEARLPAGSVIQFRQRGFWEIYRWPVTGAILIVLLQTALIAGLLVNRAKRRRGEAEATLIADISSRFVNLPPGDVDREIEGALRDFCEPLGIDLALLWQWSDAAPGIIIPTHTYCVRQDLRPSPMRQDQYPWALQQVLAGRTFAISSLKEFPPEAAVDRDTCRQFGVKAGVCIPLSVGGEPPIGALGLNCLRTEHAWPDLLLKRLQMVAQIFANALARKHAEQAMLESERRFRLLIEQAPEAILVQDFEQGRFVMTNAHAERLFGCSGAELLTSDSQRFYAPEQRDGQPGGESMHVYFERALSGETVVFEQTICNALGQRVDCEVRLTKLPAAGRNLIRASYIDITARKEAETALRQSQEDLRALAGRLISAKEEENRRLARELHDVFSQRLVLLKLQVSGLERELASPSGSLNKRLQWTAKEIDSLAHDIHQLSRQLHPSILLDLGLTVALSSECAAFSLQHGIVAEFQPINVPDSLPQEISLSLYRIAQEALWNVAKHGQAEKVRLFLSQVDRELVLAVEDNGKGFDPNRIKGEGGLGMVSMEERARLAGGGLFVQSEMGKGTRVEARIPLPEPEG